MSVKDYLSAAWGPQFTNCGLADFENLWKLPLKPLEKPNIRRGGISQVFLMSLPACNTPTTKFVIKRQRNHLTRTPVHPIHGIPTLRKEFHNIQLCHRLNIPTVEPVYYAESCGIEGRRAILITEYLEGYIPLNQLARHWQRQGGPDNGLLTSVIDIVAHLIRKLHNSRLQQRYLYPKHILIRLDNHAVDARLIDLEGLHHSLIGDRYRYLDLSVLHRRSKSWKNTDKMRFLHQYLNLEHLDKPARKLCHQILKRSKEKNTRETHHKASALSHLNQRKDSSGSTSFS